MLLEGLFLPLATPFYGDGRVYFRKLEHNAARYSRTPAAGLAFLTSIGEADRLTDLERREVLRTAAAATAETKVLLADVSHGSVTESIRLTEVAAAEGYDVVLLRVPHAAVAEQRTYLRAIADRSALPVVADESAVELPLQELLELAQHPQVIGCRTRRAGEQLDSVMAGTAGVQREVTVTTVFEAVTGRMLRNSVNAAVGAATYISAEALLGGAAVAEAPPVPALKTRSRRVGFQVLAGATEGSLNQLRAGARGTMQGFAAAAPQACFEVLAAWKDGDEPLADEKFERIRQAATEIEDGLGVAGLKAASDLTGYYGGRPRLPGLPLTAEQVECVERLMRGMRN